MVVAIEDGHAAVSSRDRELDDVLADLAGSGMYRGNAFRVTGLPVTASKAQIRRRREEAVMAAELNMPMATPAGELAMRPPPDRDAVSAAFEALHHPVTRLVHELLWSWGQEDGADDHDYAVRRHFGVLEGPSLIEPGRPEVTDDPRAQQWLVANRAWADVLAGEEVWDYARRRVQELDDPRLTTGTVRRLRARLPRHLVEITARLALRAAEHDGPQAADRYLWVLDESTFDDDIVDEVLTELVRPVADRVRAACATADDTARERPKEAVETGWLLVADVATPLRIILGVLGEDDPVTRAVHDEVAGVANHCAVAQFNKTSKRATVSELLEHAAFLAREQTTIDLVDRNLSTIEGGVVADLVHDLLMAGKVDKAAARLRALRRRTDDERLRQTIDDALADPIGLVGRLQGGAPIDDVTLGFGTVSWGRRPAGSGKYITTRFMVLFLLVLLPMNSYLRDHTYFYGKVPVSGFVRTCRWLVPLGYFTFFLMSLPFGVMTLVLGAAAVLLVVLILGGHRLSADAWAAKQVDD